MCKGHHLYCIIVCKRVYIYKFLRERANNDSGAGEGLNGFIGLFLTIICYSIAWMDFDIEQRNIHSSHINMIYLLYYCE